LDRGHATSPFSILLLYNSYLGWLVANVVPLERRLR
jgi:hypothetical protein